MSANGLMMDKQLTINSIMNYAEQIFGDVEILSVTSDNPCHRYSYNGAFKRIRKLANAITKYNLPPGSRIGTLAWNDHRYFELYFGINCLGYVCHTINPCFFPEQIEYVIANCEEQLLFLDPLFLPLIEAIHSKLPWIKQYILLTDDLHMPASKLANICSYEAFIADASDQFTFTEPDNNAISCLCYGSCLTNRPIGLEYSHQQSVLHTMSNIMPNTFEFNSKNLVTPILKLEALTFSQAPGSQPMATPDKNKRLKLKQAISAFMRQTS